VPTRASIQVRFGPHQLIQTMYLLQNEPECQPTSYQRCLCRPYYLSSNKDVLLPSQIRTRVCCAGWPFNQRGAFLSSPFLIMSDNVQKCLYLTPVPHLKPAFTSFSLIWSLIQQAKASKEQLETFAQSIAELLYTLDNEYRTKRLLIEQMSEKPLADLCRFVGCTVT
jgi:hypothetical protein